jgi:hypothetical protein
MAPSKNRLNQKGGPQSGPFTVRAKVKSRTAKRRVFRAVYRELPLFAEGGTDI